MKQAPTLTVLLAAATALLAPPGAPALAQTKPQCTVNEGAAFYRQQEYGKAFTCWEKIALRGNGAAQYNIARMYALGEGVPFNLVESYKWMKIAEKSGRIEAIKAATSIAAKLNPVQREEAERRITEFYTGSRR